MGPEARQKKKKPKEVIGWGQTKNPTHKTKLKNCMLSRQSSFYLRILPIFAGFFAQVWILIVFSTFFWAQVRILIVFSRVFGRFSLHFPGSVVGFGLIALYFPGFLGQCHFCISDSPMFSSISGFQGQNGVQKGQDSGVWGPENTIKIGFVENTTKQREILWNSCF